MDIVNQLVAALVAGAAVNAKDIGGKAVNEAYAGLKTAVSLLFEKGEALAGVVETNPASQTAQNDLRNGVGEISVQDQQRLQPKIDALNNAIASSPDASAVAQSILKQFHFEIDQVARAKIAGITAEGQDVVAVKITNVQDLDLGQVTAKTSPGN